jgi:hypothetical protein
MSEETMKPIEPLNLHHFGEEFFRGAIRRHVEEYVAHFGERLVAIYVSGSVHRNEAVPGVSDLDLFSFIRDSLREEDGEWRERTRQRLDGEPGALAGLTLPRTLTDGFRNALASPLLLRFTIIADPVDGTLRCQRTPNEELAGAGPRDVLPAWVESRILQPDEARPWALRMRYDATLVWGRELTEGIAIPPPDHIWARVSFLSPWEMVRYAAGKARENQTDFDLPDEPRLRLRYLAKLAVYGGASLLMARGAFRSYRGLDVLDPLARAEPAWAPFLEETRGLYMHPVNDAVERLSGYLERVTGWMEWIAAGLGYEGGLTRLN